MSEAAFYSEDLSRIHHQAFGDLAHHAAVAVVGALARAGIATGHIVDLGCGSGILARALTATGYQVTGVDVSRDMLAIARTVAPSANFIQGSLYEVAIPPCTAVTAVGEPLTYGDVTQRDRAMLLERIARAVRPGGLLIFDVVLCNPENPQRYSARREGDGWAIQVDVQEEPEQCRLTRRIRISRTDDGVPLETEELHRVTTVEAETIDAQLTRAGFTFTRRAHYSGHPLPPRRLAYFATRQ